MADETNLPEPIITIEDAGPAKKKLRIEIPADLISAKVDENYDSLQAEAQIPGFRKGRAPMRLLQKRFGADIKSDVCRQVIGEGYQKAVEDNNFRVLGDPDIKDMDDLELPDEGALTFEVEIEVVPEFELPDLAGLEINKPMFEVSDDDVTKELERYCEMYGQPKETDTAAFEDYVTADITVKGADGETVDEQSGGYIFVAGESRKFKGAVAGISATGPKQHEDEKIRGQELSLEVRITKVERLAPMPVEELVTMMGVKDEDGAREQFRDGLEARVENDQQRAMHSQVVDALLDKVEVELPEGLSSRQAAQIQQRQVIELMQSGATEQDIEQQVAELRDASAEQAGQQLKQLFILDKVAEHFDVQVDEAEVNGQIAMLAAQQGARPEQMRQHMAQSGQLQQLFVQLRETKAIQKIVDGATIKEISPDEWEKLTGADEDKPKKKTTKKTKKKSAAKKEAKAKSDDSAEASDEAPKKKTKKKSTKKKTTKKSS
ncbi:MAG: trigger factor [Planctomycetota bacterium]|jgi:trigger factor